MEKTLVIIKPGAIQRGLIGEVIRRFEQKGLQICGLKMIQLTDELLTEHYAHIAEKPFFPRVKAAMKAGIEAAVQVPGVLKISAGNFGGNLGAYKIALHDLF